MKTIFHTACACKVERESLLYCLPQTTGAHDSNTETIPMSKRVRWTWLGMLRHLPSHGNHETKNPHYVPHKKFFCHIHNSTSLHIRVMHHHVLNASAAVERGQKCWKSQTVHENAIVSKFLQSQNPEAGIAWQPARILTITSMHECLQPKGSALRHAWHLNKVTSMKIENTLV